MRENQVFVWDGAMLFALWDISNVLHHHYAGCLMVAPDDPFHIGFENESPAACRAGLLAPNAAHTLSSRGARFVNILFEPQHKWFRQLKPLFARGIFVELDRHAFEFMETDWEGLFAGRWDCEKASEWAREAVEIVAGVNRNTHALDPRLSQALHILQNSEHERVTPAAIGRKVGLSPFTLMRLFKAHLGVRISEYILWRRLIRGLAMVDGKRTLTEIAHEVGFYDHAHLTRTAQRMAGLQPSFFNGNQPLRVCRCNTPASATC